MLMPRKRILEFFNLRGLDCQFIASFGIPFRPRSGQVQGGNGGVGEYDPYVPRIIAQAREELPAGEVPLDCLMTASLRVAPPGSPLAAEISFLSFFLQDLFYSVYT